MGLVDVIREAIDGVRRWYERAEREQQEHRAELLKPPPVQGKEPDQLKREVGGQVLDFADMESSSHPVPLPPPLPPPSTPAPPRIGQSASQGMQPYRKPESAGPGSAKLSGSLPPPQQPELVLPPPDPDKVVGLRKREKGGAEPIGGLVQNETNDTIYNQRNEVVAVIHERYAKYGDSIASAILAKSFLPNGLELLLSRLNVGSIGSAIRDHDQIVAFIDREGLESFCSRVGIRFDPERVKKERERYESSERSKAQQKRASTKNSGSPASLMPPSTGADPRIQLQKMNLKPITLPPSDGTPGGVAPPPPTPPRTPAAIPAFPRTPATPPILTPPPIPGPPPVPSPPPTTQRGRAPQPGVPIPPKLAPPPPPTARRPVAPATGSPTAASPGDSKPRRDPGGSEAGPSKYMDEALDSDRMPPHSRPAGPVARGGVPEPSNPKAEKYLEDALQSERMLPQSRGAGATARAELDASNPHAEKYLDDEMQSDRFPPLDQ